MFRKIIYILFIVVLVAPAIANAQSKPKLVVSKDRTVNVTKQQKQTKKANPQKRRQVTARKPQRRPTVESPQYASFLRVDQQSSVTINDVNSYGGKETFSVSTDGKEWSVVGLPSWCRVTQKDIDSFVLSCDANTSHDDRSDSFKVISDNQEVRVDIKQNGAPLHITANFYWGYLHHNEKRDFEGGDDSPYLRINTDVTIKGAKGQKCLVCAFISDENDHSVKASYGYTNYSISSNNVYAAKEVTPTSDEEQSFDVDIYLPNNAMKLLKKRNKLRCHLALYCVKTAKYINGADYTLNFRAYNKKSKVTTKKP